MTQMMESQFSRVVAAFVLKGAILAVKYDFSGQ